MERRRNAGEMDEDRGRGRRCACAGVREALRRRMTVAGHT